MDDCARLFPECVHTFPFHSVTRELEQNKKRMPVI